MKKKRILSGMRPTGSLHLGHLEGALRNWRILQQQQDCFFMVADWHALMSEYENPENIKKYSMDIVIDWLSCGIDPAKSTIFIQSDIKAHLELFMIFSSFTPLGWLKRNPTYKEQIRELKEKKLDTYSFLGYPILQAADILVYNADAVPVGKDQLPHLEITRQIARKFNLLYGSILTEPDAILTPVSKLLGIDNRKMSKSYGNCISLADSPEIIRKKVLSMFTDTKRIKVSDPGHPEKCNVYSYYSFFKPEMANQLKKECKEAEIGCVKDKKRLADILIEYLRPIREKKKQLLNQKDQINKMLKESAEKASAAAEKTLKEVKKAMKLK